MDDDYVLLCTESASNEPPQTRILPVDGDDDIVVEFANETAANNTNSNKQQFEIYLKKHKLDVTLLPNKKIKLSDLTATRSTETTAIESFIFTNNHQTHEGQEAFLARANDLGVEEDENEDDEECELEPSRLEVFGFFYTVSDGLKGEEFEDYDEDDDEEDYDDDDEDYEDCDEDVTNEKIDKFINDNCPLSNDDHGDDTNESSQKRKKIKMRKKREPSLKLIQKLNSDDLQLIVNSIKANEAQVYSADIKKDQYIDKILKVKLYSPTQSLSNGQNEALLKKSMFPKDLNLLFDSFVKALFREQFIYEDVSLIREPYTCGQKFNLLFHLKSRVCKSRAYSAK
jgi:hypothetical protein